MTRINILFGGPAGTGPNILTHVTASALSKLGYYVFYSRDYQSLIRGGHNFNVLTFSDKPVESNDSKIDIIVAFDEKTLDIHKKNLKQNGVVISPEKGKGNMYYAGRLFKILCLDFKYLNRELKELEKRYKENFDEARLGYLKEKSCLLFLDFIKKSKLKKTKKEFINGSQGIALGALASGMDIYYAYPMTPATPVLTELAQMTLDKKNKHKVIELENELAVANAGVGSAMTGSLVMVGTSGGGFDLMTETLSLCGMAEVPLVFYLAQRPGPATGVATYTAQGDLNIALKAGHGEFPRIVVAAGDPIEAEGLTNQIFYLTQKFQTPGIILSDKHLGECFYSCEEKAKLGKIKRKTEMKRYNSYEQDLGGSATEDSEIIEKNVLDRIKKGFELEKEAKKFIQFKLFGNKNSENVVVFWGSTKGAVLDAIKELDVLGIQILYMDPFPKEVAKYLKNKNIILIEHNSTGQLGELIREKTGIMINEKILKINGRPFLADELKGAIKGKLGGGE